MQVPTELTKPQERARHDEFDVIVMRRNREYRRHNRGSQDLLKVLSLSEVPSDNPARYREISAQR